MFFYDKGKTLRVVTDVASAIQRGDQTVAVHLRGTGDEIIVDEEEWDQALVRMSHSFVPAHVGTYALSIFWKSERELGGYSQKIVVGWAIGGDGLLHAWTVDGADDGHFDRPAILHPDGRVEDPANRTYDNVGEWFEAEKAYAREHGFKRQARET